MGRLKSSLIIARERGLAPPPLRPAALTGLFKVELRFTQNGQKLENVYHFKETTRPSDEELEAYTSFMASQFAAEVMPLLSSELVLVDAKGTDLSVDDGNVIIYTPLSPIAGGNAGDPATPFDAIKVKAITGLSGRARTGWKRLAGLVKSYSTNGVLDPTFREAVNDAFQSLRAILVADGRTPVVASFFDNNAARTVPLATPITEWIALPEVTSQTSRKFNHGD